jgi:hypothetical protein
MSNRCADRGMSRWAPVRARREHSPACIGQRQGTTDLACSLSHPPTFPVGGAFTRDRRLQCLGQSGKPFLKRVLQAGERLCIALCLSCGTSPERIAPESLTRSWSDSFTAISRSSRNGCPHIV